MSEAIIGDISSLLDEVGQEDPGHQGDGIGQVDQGLNLQKKDGDVTISNYIKNGLVPNLQGLYREIQARIDAINPEKDVGGFEVLDLKEERFVEAIKLLTHPEIANRLKLLQEDLNSDEDSPIQIGLTLVGSAAFGGLLIREALGEDGGPWVDVDLIASYVLKDTFGADSAKPDQNSLSNYLIKAQKEVKQKFNSGMIKSPKSKDYNLCDAHNIENMRFEIVQSKEMAMQLIDWVHDDKASPSIIYEQFFPSYPDHVNAVGRHYLLETLKELAAIDKEKWKVVVTKISDGLKHDVKFLKPKHFGKEENDNISERLDKINEFIASLFTDLVGETKGS